MSKNGFGTIHELAKLEAEMRRDLASVRHMVYTSIQALDDPQIQIKTIKSFLEDAEKTLRRLAGD